MFRSGANGSKRAPGIEPGKFNGFELNGGLNNIPPPPRPSGSRSRLPMSRSGSIFLKMQKCIEINLKLNRVTFLTLDRGTLMVRRNRLNGPVILARVTGFLANQISVLGFQLILVLQFFLWLVQITPFWDAIPAHQCLEQEFSESLSIFRLFLLNWMRHSILSKRR